MAGYTLNSPSRTRTRTVETQKADAYINLRVNGANGSASLSKLGIALYRDNPIHQAIIAHVDAGGDIADLLSKLELSFQLVTDPVDIGFTL
jgi:hypothetical protein